MNKIAMSLTSALLLALSTQASAAPLFDQAAPTGELTSPGSVSYTFNAGAGAGSATFDILGYRSIDGRFSGFDDVFTLSLNGTAIYSATFVLGGLGSNFVFLKPTGATETAVSNGFFAGGTASLFVPLDLIAGTNTLTLAYSGASQGSADEAFGIGGLSVVGNAPAGAVPEPAAWAMMIGGIGLAGGAMRRRRAAVRTAVSFA